MSTVPNAINPLAVTEWVNPTDNAVKFSLFEGSNKSAPWVTVEIPAKGRTLLPSIYDNAVRKERGGVVGLAPQLLKASEVSAEASPKAAVEPPPVVETPIPAPVAPSKAEKK